MMPPARAVAVLPPASGAPTRMAAVAVLLPCCWGMAVTGPRKELMSCSTHRVDSIHQNTHTYVRESSLPFSNMTCYMRSCPVGNGACLCAAAGHVSHRYLILLVVGLPVFSPAGSAARHGSRQCGLASMGCDADDHVHGHAAVVQKQPKRCMACGTGMPAGGMPGLRTNSLAPLCDRLVVTHAHDGRPKFCKCDSSTSGVTMEHP